MKSQSDSLRIVEADVGDEQFLGPRRSDRRRLEVERVGARVDDGSVAGPDEVEIAGRSFGRDEPRVPLLRPQLRWSESRGSGDLLARRERHGERRVPIELDGKIAGGNRESGDGQRALARVACGERRLLRGAQKHQAEVDAWRLHVQQADHAISGEDERQRVASGAGRHLHRRQRRAEMRGREIDANSQRLFCLERDCP